MNWKSTVSRLNARTYAFPDGWDTRETIAAQLECSPDRVDTLLAPGLKSGEIEKQQFPVWDARLGRKNLVWGYRQRQSKAETPSKNSSKTPAAVEGIPPHLLKRVTETCLRYQGRRPSQIADLCRWSGEPRLTARAIRQLLDTLAP
jgi:hypothetical protein